MDVECSECGHSPDLTVADIIILDEVGAVATECPECREFARFETEAFRKEAEDA